MIKRNNFIGSLTFFQSWKGLEEVSLHHRSFNISKDCLEVLLKLEELFQKEVHFCERIQAHLDLLIFQMWLLPRNRKTGMKTKRNVKIVGLVLRIEQYLQILRRLFQKIIKTWEIRRKTRLDVKRKVFIIDCLKMLQ